MKQIVAHKKLSAPLGLALVLGLVAALILINFALTLLKPAIGYAAASVGFWLIGGLLALGVLRYFVVAYSYELSQDTLRLCRHYGRRERLIEDIYLSRVAYVGAPDEAAKRYPNARRLRAIQPSRRLSVTAVVYSDARGPRTALIQADDDLKQRLIERVRRG